MSETQRDWDERLPQVLAAYGASPHSATGFTPNRLFLGRETQMPIDLVWRAPTEDPGAEQPLEEYVEKMKDNVE